MSNTHQSDGLARCETNLQGFNRPLPPIARMGLPFIGPAIRFLNHPIECFLSLKKRYGSIFRLYLGGRCFYMMSGHEGCELLSKHANQFVKSSHVWKPLARSWDAPNLMFTLDEKPLAELRKMLKPTMCKDLANKEHKKIEALCLEVLANASQKSYVAVRELNSLLVSHIVNYTSQISSRKLQDDFILSSTEWLRYSVNMFVINKWPRIIKFLPKFRKLNKMVLNYLTDLKSYEKENGSSALFNELSHQVSKQKDKFQTEGDLNSLILLSFLGATQTLAPTLNFFIYELYKNPELYKMMQDEVDALIQINHGVLPSPQLIEENAPMLYGFCQENLRRHPVVYAVNRRAIVDFVFKGYRIPKDAEIYFFSSANHFDEKVFKEPFKFDITRFTSPRNEHQGQYAFLPYGIGPHVCLAAGFSDKIMITIAATFLHFFNFKVVKAKKQYKFSCDPSLNIEKNFLINLSIRKKIMTT